LTPPRFENNSITGEDVQKQGPAPFYYTAPVIPQVSGSNTFWIVDLPIVAAQTAGTNVLNVTGNYNGMSWMLRADATGATNNGIPIHDVVYLGTGSEQRRLVIRTIQVSTTTAADGSTLATAKLFLAAPSLTGTFPSMDANTPAHPVLITNVIAGNPGPQPDFDHRLPNYRGVVLYSVIMD
jgi:hypothetical protein